MKLDLPQDYIDEHPNLDSSIHHIDPFGMISQWADNQEEGLHSWYVDGYLTTPERFESWLPVLKQVQPPQPEILKAFNDFLPMAYEKNICPFAGMVGPFTNVIESMGLKAYARAMRKNRDFVKRVLDVFTDITCAYFQALVQNTDAQLFYIADDVAMKNNVMLAPRVMEEFYLDSYKRIVKSVGDGYIYFHSDGFVEPLIPYMIEAGFHGVQCLEEAAGVDIRRVKKEYGDQICLIGNMDVSRDLYYASPKDIAKKAQKLVEDLGPEGYIFGPCSTIYAGHPLENIRAMVEGWQAGNKKWK
jgi:uroporphyrinogen decarboxylase